MTDRLDDLIEQGLAASFARVDSRPPLQPRYLASRSATRRWRVAPALAGLPAALGTKVAVALAAATIAGTGVAAKAALTGNPNPITWGGQAQPPARACAGGPCPGTPTGGRAAAPALPSPAATASPGADHGGAPVALPSADGRGDAGVRAHGAGGGGTPAGPAADRHQKADGQSPAADGNGSHGTSGHGASDGGERPER